MGYKAPYWIGKMEETLSSTRFQLEPAMAKRLAGLVSTLERNLYSQDARDAFLHDVDVLYTKETEGAPHDLGPFMESISWTTRVLLNLKNYGYRIDELPIPKQGKALGGGKRRHGKVVATLIKSYPTLHGSMHFLGLSRPVAYREAFGEGPLEHASHVVVSESQPRDKETGEPIITDTAIFPAYPDGRIASHGRQLRGSLSGRLDWRAAVKKAGWELVAPGGGKRRHAAKTPSRLGALVSDINRLTRRR